MKEVRSSLEQLRDDVESMCQWLESLNIAIDKNRIAEYRKTFAAIAEHVEKGTVDKLKKSIDFPKQADNFHDVSELIWIHQHLSGYDSQVFKRTLAQAVNGPSPLAAERPQTSDARNKVFELVMAAQFHAAGLRPKFVEPDDCIITVAGAKCRVECKRIQTENSLAENVAKAFSQIEHRLSQEASVNTRGLIAIDISKLLNTDGTLYFSVISSDHLNQKINEYLQGFLKKNRAKLKKNLYRRVSAVLLYLRTPAVIETQGGLLTNFRRLFPEPSLWNDGKKMTFSVTGQCRSTSKAL